MPRQSRAVGQWVLVSAVLIGERGAAEVALGLKPRGHFLTTALTAVLSSTHHSLLVTRHSLLTHSRAPLTIQARKARGA
jgi:hypothetical protein